MASDIREAEQGGPVVCAVCGATAESLPLGWSTSVERGRRVVHCESCSRENVRAMESKLDPEWW
jgi:predicted  nucleic acid-binding Zn-ribbon protein